MSMFSARKLGKNELILEEGSHIVRATFHGTQSMKELEEINAGMHEDIMYLKQTGLPALLLIDLSNIQKMTGAQRRYIVNSMDNLGFDKLAIFGGSVFIGMAARFLISVSHNQARIRYFVEEEPARKWLKD